MSPLIDAESLHARLDDPDSLVVDCRHDLADPGYGRRAYASGHIPASIFLHVDEDLSGQQRGVDGRFRGRHPLPDRETFARRLSQAGLTPDMLLVAYDDGDSMYAARLWWLAQWIGHERVAVLDGGLKAWRSREYEISTELPQARSAAAAAAAGEPLVATVDADTLLADLTTGRYRILDARAGERYRGDVEPIDARAGHIPGAHNRTFRANLRDDGRFKSPSQLREEFTAVLAGMPLDRVVHQCGSGVSACHNLLAMTVASMPGTLLYPGSWSEWSSDPKRPVATGSTP
jgi:thiosulfate/3-mercaptopyruvate sulfurtransferase